MSGVSAKKVRWIVFGSFGLADVKGLLFIASRSSCIDSTNTGTTIPNVSAIQLLIACASVRVSDVW